MPENHTLHGVRALAHPSRLRILSLLTGAAVSAGETPGHQLSKNPLGVAKL
jgi:hypothetical protein